MKVLLIGSGGREHALYWKILQSPQLEEIYVYPGNGGILEEHRLRKENYGDLFHDNFSGIKKILKEKEIDLVIVGPEQPLVDGLADAIQDYCLVFGPNQQGAKIEGSKSYARSFMDRFGIPSAKFQVFNDSNKAIEYLEQIQPPYVIKADGLAAGKGVTVTENKNIAIQSIKDILDNKIFGNYPLLIEEFLEGKEASIFAFCDGEKAIPMQPARDYKRAYDNNQGPNTGGMGSVTPVEYINQELLDFIQKEIFDKTIEGFKKLNIKYKGILYAGLMIYNNKAKVVEFNCRFGDPEIQALLPILDEDLLDLCFHTASGTLSKYKSKLQFKNLTSMTVVVAAEGYPKSYKKNINLTEFLDNIPEELIVFHAGTEYEKNTNQYFSMGGRILNITATGKSIEEVRSKIYRFLDNNKVPDTFYRKDIGILY
ncbi:MAG: phosphoribosylamine--glycine ligase [Leptospiraceae bacterium]|nr:MAG: phosphoribosylamine--glycine ligase [Leptospiraceae bacterium]